MANQLNIDEENITFSAVFRIGQSNVAINDHRRLRCIMAKFVRRADRDRVLAASRNLRGTTYGFAEDLPWEWAQIRKKAHPTFVKPARQRKQQIRWRGAKLYIDGAEVDLTAKQQRQNAVRPSRARDRHSSRNQGRRQRHRSPSHTATRDNNSNSSRGSSTDSDRPRRSSDSILTQPNVEGRSQHQLSLPDVQRSNNKGRSQIPTASEAGTSSSGPTTRSKTDKSQQKLDRFGYSKKS